MKPDQYTRSEAKAALFAIDLSGPIKGEVYLIMIEGRPTVGAYTGIVNKVGQYNFRIAQWDQVDDPEDGVVTMPPMGECAWNGILPLGWTLMNRDGNVKYLGITHAKLVP